MTRYLIVNADDFGISRRVSEGIIEAHQRGIVTSTSVMAHMPAAPDAIRRAQQDAPRLGMGLHITMSFGSPVSPADRVPSLVTPSGTFCSTMGELVEISKAFTAEDLQTEITAQIERFITLAGRPPDHLDSHHNVSYWVPAAFDVMLKLAAQYGIPIRSPGQSLENPAVQQVLEANQKPRWPQELTHEPVFYDTGATPENLRAILANLPEGAAEFICHPGHPDDLQEAYAAPRETELALLTDPAVRDLLQREGVQLVSFADFARMG